MTEAELTLVDLREQVREALLAMECGTAFSVRQSWPREQSDGVVVTYREYDNRSTSVSVVDAVEYQIDIWAFERETVVALAEQVNCALLTMGLKRTYMGPETLENGMFEHKTLRFGRKVDKRWMRLVD